MGISFQIICNCCTEVFNTACVQGSANGTNGIPVSFKVLPMVPLVIPFVPMVMSMVPLALQMLPIGTIGKPMVPLVTNGTIGKITNGTIGRISNRATANSFHYCTLRGVYRYIYIYCSKSIYINIRKAGDQCR